MRAFWNRPMAFACVLFAVLSVCCIELPSWIKLCIGGVCLLAFFALLWRKPRRYAPLLSALLASLCMLSSVLFFDLPYQKMQAYVGERVTAEGVVIERVESTAYSSRLRIRLERLNGEEMRRTVVLETAYATSEQIGDRVFVSATARAFDKEAEYDEEYYLLSKGDMLVLSSQEPSEITLLEGRDEGLFIRLLQLNQALSYRLYTRVEGEAGGLSAALLLGNRSFLSPHTEQIFRRVGVSHLLALSGLHVSALIAALELFLRLLRLPKRARFVIVPICALFYLALTGFSPSTVRATVMVCALYLTFHIGARYDAFTVLTQTLACILFVTPYAVWDVSVWMSFLAAASILLFSPAFDRFYYAIRWHKRLPVLLYKIAHAVLGALFVGLVANLALLLVSAGVFGSVSLLSVPATMLLSPVVTCLLPLSLLAFLGGVFSAVAGFLGNLMIAAARFASRPEGIVIPVDDPCSVCVILLITALLVYAAVASVRGRGHKLILTLSFPILLVALVVCSSAYTRHSQRDFSIHTSKSHAGEVVLISRRGDAVAVDMTSGTVSDVSSLATLLASARCMELDELIMTRYYSRAPFFVSAMGSKTTILRLRLPPPRNDDERAIAMRLEEEAALLGISVTYGLEALGVEDVEALAFCHTPFDEDGSRVLLSLRLKESVFTIFNGAVLESEYASLARNLLEESDVALLAKRAVGDSFIRFGANTRTLLCGAEPVKQALLILPPRAMTVTLDEPFCLIVKVD